LIELKKIFGFAPNSKLLQIADSNLAWQPRLTDVRVKPAAGKESLA
jgi:hypothetical protein